MNLSGNVVSSLLVGGQENQMQKILSQPNIEDSNKNSMNYHAESSPTIHKTHGFGDQEANLTFVIGDESTL